MKKTYLKKNNWILILLVLQTIYSSNIVTGQTIYKGDSVQLSVTNSYRGAIKWQESVNGTTWVDIAGGTINNMWVKPLVNTQFRAIVTEEACDPIYSIIKAITISTDTGLVVNTPVVSSFNASVVNLDGQIIRLGGDAKVAARGMCWSKSNNPTINDSKTSDGIGISTFNSIISGLTENTTYYIRSYTITDGGIVIYSNEITVTTLPSVTISTVNASNITAFTATAGGNITLNGTETVLAKGVCWNTSQNPTIADSKTTDGIGAGTYSSSLTNLISEKIYYLKAYVTASNGITYYGEQTTFETSPSYVFTVQTAITSVITGTTGASGGIVTMTGTGSIAARGVCWGTNNLPTIADNKTSNGTGLGNYTSPLTGLIPATIYYVRAYVTSPSGRTTYGNEVVFTTKASFEVTTSAITAITAGTAISGGAIVLNTADVVITNRGVCWGVAANPTINDEKTDDGTAVGLFSNTLFELKPNTKYYVRAFATDNTASTVYGNELSFTTLLPLVISITTANPTSITLVSANSGGTITTTGPGSVTDRGVCYSSNPSPTIVNNILLNGTGIGTFASLVTGLNSGEPIYLRAFATSNSGTTTYGNEVNFTTLKVLDVTTAAVTAITANTATAGGIILLRSGTVTSRGVCWSMAHYPTILDSKITSGTGGGTFTSAITGLTKETTYYARAFATDGTGKTMYGEEVAFRTLPNIFITTAVPAEINDIGALVGGTLTINTANTVGLSLTSGVCWSTTPYPIVINNMPNSLIGSYKAGDFIFRLQTLYSSYEILPGIKYYVRAFYNEGSGRIIYGNQETFTTTFTKGFMIKTVPVSGITKTSAISGGTLGVGSTETSTSRGICWSQVPNPTILDSKTVSGNGAGDWTSTMTGLSPGTVYYVRAYTLNASGTAVYAKTETFTTLGQESTEFGISILTSPILYLTSNSGSGGGTITNNGAETIESRGINILNSAGTTTLKYTTGTTGSFAMDLDFPFVNTIYQIRAFVRTASGKTIYGNTVEYNQDDYNAARNGSFQLKVTAKATSAVIGLTKFSNNQLDSYGFVYGTEPSPTILNNKMVVDSDVTSNYLLKDLKASTAYYVRIYIVYKGMVMYFGDTEGFKTLDSDAFMVKTSIGGGSVGSYNMGGNVVIWEPTTIVSRGVCYSLEPNPTIASSKVLDSSGIADGDFSVKLESMIQGSYYYCRAFATSSDGYTSYGNEIKILALAYVPPPATVVSDPGTITKDDGGTGGGTPVAGPKYFVFARAYGPATNCNEGSWVFSDVKGIGKWLINGVFDTNSYTKQKIEMDTFIRTQFPGNNYFYGVETSYDFCQTAKHAVIIQYTKKIPGWDCYSTMITAGYGNTVAEALNHAVLRKNNDINGAKSATYKVIQTISW